MSDAVCFLCGKPGADTREHIVSRAFYVPPLPGDMLTAPSHLECNRSTSRDEEWLTHTWALTRPAQGTNQARWQRSVRALQREESTKMREAFLASFGDQQAGWVPVHVDLLRIQYVLAKIVKGLLFHADGQILSEGYTWTIRSIDLELMVKQPYTRQIEVHDVAVFRWETLGSTVFWVLGLYNMHIYWGLAVAPAEFDALAARLRFVKAGVRLPWPKPKG